MIREDEEAEKNSNVDPIIMPSMELVLGLRLEQVAREKGGVVDGIKRD